MSRVFDPGVGRKVTGVDVREEYVAIDGESRRRTRVGFAYGGTAREPRWWERGHRWVGRVIATAVVLGLMPALVMVGAHTEGVLGVIVGYQLGVLGLWFLHHDCRRGLWHRLAEWWTASWLSLIYLVLVIVVGAAAGWSGMIAVAVACAWWLHV